jgi:hypothetical protein
VKRGWGLGILLGGMILVVVGGRISLQDKIPQDTVKPLANCLPNKEIASNVGGAVSCRDRPDQGPGTDNRGTECPSHIEAVDSRLSDSDPEEPEAPIRSWARENPSAAATWAAQQADPVVRQEALNQVALAWAESDVTKAIAWAAQLPADEIQSDILVNLGYEAARKDPRQALDLTGLMSPSRNRDDLVIHAVSQWADLDALAATEWACTIPELTLRERVLASITTAVADQNPEAAVMLITEALWPGASQNQAAIATVQRWSQQDPQGAKDWVQQFPAGELKDTALLSLVAVSLD